MEWLQLKLASPIVVIVSDNSLVIESAKLSQVGNHETVQNSPAKLHLTKLNGIVECFFFRGESTSEDFFTFISSLQ